MLVRRVSLLSSRVSKPVYQCKRTVIASQKATTGAPEQQQVRTSRRKVHGLGKFPGSVSDSKVPQYGPTDYSNRNFAYGMIGATGVVGTVMTKNFVGNFVAMLSPNRSVLAVSNVEVDLKKVPLGNTLTFEWRGKPLLVRHREQWEIDAARNTPMAMLKDPQKDEDRVQEAEWLIVLGVCTHLGCVPIANQGNYKGFFCPCHGSHYDTSARIREGPAPLNLEVPPYHFIPNKDNIIMVGVGKDDI